MTDTDDIKAWQHVVGADPDGNPGPKTFRATVSWFRAHGYIPPVRITGELRAAVVAEAKRHVGIWAESDVDDVWREVGAPELVGHWHDKAWCGGYALRCLRRGAGVDWRWVDGRGFLEVHGLPKVSLPEPGDVAYFAKNQHHAIVVDVALGMVTLVNGNGLPAPAEGVTVTSRPLGDVSTFYSIGRIA